MKYENQTLPRPYLTFFKLSEKNIWIYGAGVQGLRLLADLQAFGGIRIMGFIDRRAQDMPKVNGYEVVDLASQVNGGGLNESSFILVASRHWQAIQTACEQMNLVEARDFVCLGRYCESFSPLEFKWFLQDAYYDPYESIRQLGKFEPCRDHDQAGMYDYFSHRAGDFTLAEGQYLESTVAHCRPNTVLELGASRGKSTLFLAKGLIEHGGQEVVTVDTWGWKANELETLFHEDFACDFFEEFSTNINFDPEFACAIRPRRETVQSFLKKTSQQFELAFIDLFHSYDETIEVFQLLNGKLANGAQLIFHDYSPYWAGEVRAIDELIADGKVSVVNKSCPGSLIHLQYEHH